MWWLKSAGVSNTVKNGILFLFKFYFAAAVSASFYCSRKLTVTLTCVAFCGTLKTVINVISCICGFAITTSQHVRAFFCQLTLLFFIYLSSVSQSILALFQPVRPVGVTIVYFCAGKCFPFLSVERGNSLSHWPWWGVYMRCHQCLLSLIRQWPITAPPIPALQHSTSDGLCCVHLFNYCSLR